jgi:hypothetical protein
MPTGATGQLGLALPVQGELSGTWGDTVNNGITQYANIAIAATLTLTNDGAVTLANTTGDATASNITSSLTGAGTVTAQFAIVRVTGTLTTAKVVTAPSYSKTYTVVNAATGGIVTFKASGQTGVSIAVGESAFVYYNGTDYVKVSSTVATGVTSFTAGTTGFTPSSATTGAVTLAGTLATTNGGTGLTSFTSGGVVYASSSSALATGSALTFDGTNLSSAGLATFGSAVIGLASANTDLRVVRTLGLPTFYAGVKQSGQGAYFLGNKSDTLVIDSDPTNETAGSNIAFNVDGSEKARFDASGNLGIGTSSPAVRLDVNNSTAGAEVARFEGNFSASGTVVLANFRRNGGAVASAVRYNDATGAIEFGTTTNHAQSFITNSTEQARISSVGNLLVGGTAARGTTVGTKHLDLFDGTAPAGTLTNGVSLFSSSGDLKFMDAAGNAYTVGFRNVPQSGSSKTTSYTLATTDIGEYILLGASGAIVIPDATFAAGDVVSIFNNTASTATITCSITTAYIAGTFTDKATMTLAAAGVATVLFITSTLCVVSGNVT